jgi:hypothetical protein
LIGIFFFELYELEEDEFILLRDLDLLDEPPFEEWQGVLLLLRLILTLSE